MTVDLLMSRMGTLVSVTDSADSDVYGNVTETETETATESAPYGQPTYAGCPPYVHSIPTTAPTPDWSDHPPRKRVVWVRPYTDQETPDEEDTQP